MKFPLVPSVKRFGTLLPFVLALLLFVGCDSDSLGGGDAEVSIQGQVSDDSGFGKTAATIEGATVTAATIESDGSLSTLSGEATTNAEGRFTLDVENTDELTLLTAEKGSFSSRVIVATDYRSSGTVRAMPMTIETKAEANVFLEIDAASTSEPGRATVADVALFVNQQLAVAIENGNASAAEIAAAIEAEARAEAEYLDEADEAPADEDDVPLRERNAFAQLQADLALAASAQAEAEALSAFQSNLIESYSEAGVSLEAQARARQSGQSALVRFSAMSDSNARFALRKQAALITSMATTLAVEARFAAEGAGSTRLQALANARAALLTSLRGAASQNDLDDARATYESSIKAELQAELDVNSLVLTAAETSLMPVKAALDASVDAAASADAVATAYVTFFSTAETTAETALSTSAKASLGASVLTLLTVE